MPTTKFNPRSSILFLTILLIGTVRFLFIYNDQLSPLSNFSPVGAMAVFSGAYFNKSWKALSFPVLTLLLSDLLLSYTVFSQFRSGFLYGGWYWTYGAFILMTLCSKFITRNITVASIGVSSLAVVCVHWIVTDFGVWAGSTFYPQTLGGYGLCLAAAIPFELNLLAGTVIYNAILFGLFEWFKIGTWKYHATKNTA